MADDANLKAHEATYGGLIVLLKWGAVAALLLAALVVWLLAH